MGDVAAALDASSEITAQPFAKLSQSRIKRSFESTVLASVRTIPFFIKLTKEVSGVLREARTRT